jgi:hypothetical protein
LPRIAPSDVSRILMGIGHAVEHGLVRCRRRRSRSTEVGERRWHGGGIGLALKVTATTRRCPRGSPRCVSGSASVVIRFGQRAGQGDCALARQLELAVSTNETHYQTPDPRPSPLPLKLASRPAPLRNPGAAGTRQQPATHSNPPSCHTKPGTLEHKHKWRRQDSDTRRDSRMTNLRRDL